MLPVRTERDRTSHERKPDDGGARRLARGKSLTVHGWIYDIADGLLRDLEVSVDSAKT